MSDEEKMEMKIKRGDEAERDAPCAVRTSASDPLVRLVLTPLSVHQSFSPPSRLLPTRSSALFSSSSSSAAAPAAAASRRLAPPAVRSDSASPPTPAVGDQPLSCQMMLRVALPPSSRSIQSALFPSATPPPTFPHTHSCI